MARITLENVAKEFPGRRGRKLRAIDRLSLDIEPGELLVIVGPSGSGKTTLLRLIAGLDRVTAGTISIDGKPVTEQDPQDRDMAMVFQRDALLPHLTARENIALGLRLRGCASAEIAARVEEAAGYFQLGDALDRLPRALSGGERQRAALARAFVRRPRAFLLDEPLASLDGPLRAELRTQILKLHRRLGATIILVTHDQGEAMALGRRVAVLNNGVLQQLADPRTLYRSPANAFVAGFVGTPPMNLFRGRLESQGGSVWFHERGEGSRGSVCLTEAQRAALAGRAGKELIMGVRPEHIVDSRSGRPVPYGSEVKARCESMETLGAETLARCSTGVSSFIMRCAPDVATGVDEEIALLFDMQEAHFFEASGLVVWPPVG